MCTESANSIATPRAVQLHVDFETRSAVDIKKTGAYKYAEDASTDVWCMAYAFGDEPVELWTPGQACPRAIVEHISGGGLLYAHNANFERVVWHYVMHDRYGWPLPVVGQWRCTMAMALAMALPGSLDGAAAALNLDTRKDSKGYGKMLRMARPRKELDDGTFTWWDDDESKATLYAYCKQDVEVERQLTKRLIPLRPFEQKLWEIDQVINDRGVAVDEHLCLAAKKIVSAAQDKFDSEMRVVTGGDVTACSNVTQLTAFCRANGVPTDSVAKDQLDRLLARDDLPPAVREAIKLRKLAGRASVAKIDALLAGMSADKRARGLLQFHAASTGRWGGRRFQPQNIKRPEEIDIDMCIDVVASGDHAVVDMLYGDPLAAVANCLRGMVRAAPNRRIVAADYANIEGRVLAWLAGEAWKLDAFRAYDAGSGPDLYKVAYGRSFGIKPDDVDKGQRQIGKVQELALGYQGGPGAFQAMARGYGIDIGESFDLIAAGAPEAFERATAAWKQRGKRSGMAERAWIAAETVKILWREAHPNIAHFWWDLQDAALEALDNPGTISTCGPVKFRKAGSFVFLQLPSGRALVYPYPKPAMKEMPWDGEDGRPAQKRVFSYKGVDSYTRSWTECYAYGGLWAENVTQAVARDLLAEAVVRLEAADMPVVLTVHDECVSEVSACRADVQKFVSIMTELPSWAAGCPVAAEGWAGFRYRK